MTQIGVAWTRKAIDASVLTSSELVYRLRKANVRRFVATDDGPGSFFGDGCNDSLRVPVVDRTPAIILPNRRGPLEATRSS